MKKRLLLITRIDGFSGISAPIFTELNKHWEITARIDPFQIPLLRKYYILAKSFKFNINDWIQQFRENLDLYYKSPLAYQKRTKLCENKLHKFSKKYDLIFQFSSALVPSRQKPTKPYVIYLDRTLKMSERHTPDILNAHSQDEQKEIHELHEKAFNMADIIFTFNEPTSNSVINDYHLDKSKVINVGSGVNLSTLPDVYKKNTNLILTVCTDFERQKGQLSLDSFKLVRNKFPEAKFILVGKKLEDDDEQISSFSSLPYEKLLELHRDASIVIQPGLLGGMQTITEAMANKCVCIAHIENPYISGLISDKDNGFLIQTDDPQEIAGLVSMILQDNELKKSVGQNAYKHILDNYTWKIVVSRINKHLEKII